MPRKILSNVSIRKQEGHATCWAAAVQAVTGALGNELSQENLIRQFEALTGPQGGLKPEVALKALGYKADILRSGKDGISKMENEIVGAIDRDHPVICGIATSTPTLIWRKGQFNSTGESLKGQIFQMQHALICYGYDDEKGEYYFKDPARPDADVTAKKNDLFWGFRYMLISQLGDDTRVKVKPIIGMIEVLMKVVKTIVASRPLASV